MRNQSSCAKVFVGLILSLGLVAVCAFLFFSTSSYQQKQARMKYTPPTVLVTDPASGTTAFAGSYLNVSATAFGTRPIVRMELWLDGELLGTQSSEQPEGLASFDASFDVLVPSEGSHMIFVRAVNSEGVIGQSLLIDLTGEPKPAQALLAVTVQEGETLEDIATAYAAAPETLQTLNPGLGDQPPAGTLVKVPAPHKDNGPAGPVGAPPSPPANPPVEIPDLPMLTISDAHLVNPFSGIKVPFGFGPPVAPTGLQAELKGCDILLTWNDNANDEEKYNIYIAAPQIMEGAFLQATLKPSPNTGPAWYKFQTAVEGAVSLWVEAENSIGKTPSNIVYIYLPFVPGCGTTEWEARSVGLKWLDLSVNGNYDKAYCYVSFENQPEKRIPGSQTEFIQLQGGKGKSQNPNSYDFEMPLPADQVLDLNGKCLGWAGATLTELGSFSGQFPKETWNGERRTLKGNSFEIGLSLEACRKYGKNPPPGLYWGVCNSILKPVDPALPTPYDLREDLVTNPFPGQVVDSRTRTLRWKWDGDRNKNDIFQIFLNGEPYEQPFSKYPDEELKATVRRPRDCGETIIWQVAVKEGTWSGGGQGPGPLSPLSAPLKVELPECDIWLRVTFEAIRFEWTHDGAGNWDPFTTWSAEPLDAYFWLCVGNLCRYFYGGGFYRPVQAHGENGGLYGIDELIDDFHPYGFHPNVIVVPLRPGESLRQSKYTIHAEFWDHDDWSSDDLIGKYGNWLDLGVPSRGEVFQGNCSFTETTPEQVTGEARSTMTFSYEIYPNKCADIPPEILELRKEAGN